VAENGHQTRWLQGALELLKSHPQLPVLRVAAGGRQHGTGDCEAARECRQHHSRATALVVRGVAHE
jgi:hypothetical protein